MQTAFLNAAMIVLIALHSGGCHAASANTGTPQAVVEEMQRLADYEVDLVLRSDISGMARFYPDDMIVTNPFNQVIDKSKVLERVQANIICYTSMTKKVEHVRLLRADMVMIMGLETAKVTPDADRPDAGTMTYRRFTEVWELRDREWKKVVRHANHFDPDASAAQ